MSYFTETLEETMSMLEFNGDAEYSYAQRRSSEQRTHNHATGGFHAGMAKEAINKNHNGYDVNTFKSDKNESSKEKYDKFVRDSKRIAKAEHDALDSERRDAKNKGQRNDRFHTMSYS